MSAGAPGGSRLPLLVALDIDGTIVDWDQGLSDRVAAAVAGTVAAGHHVVIATGRSAAGATHVTEQLGLRYGWAVCSNGSVTLRLDPDLPGGHGLHEVITFDPAPALKLLQERLPQALFYVEGRDVLGTRLVSGPFPDGELYGEVEHVPFDRLLHTPAARVVVRCADLSREEMAEVVAASGLHGVSYAVGHTAWLDLAPEGISKASALEVVRRRLGVPANRTLAVGDGTNDLEMFAWAHRAVAMGQALPVVRAAADEVTGSVDEDGLAEVLEPLASAAAGPPVVAPGSTAGPP